MCTQGLTISFLPPSDVGYTLADVDFALEIKVNDNLTIKGHGVRHAVNVLTTSKRLSFLPARHYPILLELRNVQHCSLSQCQVM